MRRVLVALALLAGACSPAPEDDATSGQPQALPPVTIIQRECVAEACRGIAPVRDIEFGAARIGTQFEAYPRGWRRHAMSCDSAMLASSDEDCLYTHEGVIYSFDRARRLVAKQIYLIWPPHGLPAWDMSRALPYGLRGDETPQQAMAAIEANTGVTMELHDVFGHAELVSKATLYTADNAAVGIALRYEGHRRLVSITIAAPRPPADENPHRRYQQRAASP